MPTKTPPMNPTPRAPSRREKSHKAPIPAAVAAVVGAMRGIFSKAEDEHEVERESGRIRDMRGWALEFVVERDEVDGGFVAECPQLPGAMAQGETEQEAMENLADAIDGIVAVRLHRRIREADIDMSPLESVRTYTVPL